MKFLAILDLIAVYVVHAIVSWSFGLGALLLWALVRAVLPLYITFRVLLKLILWIKFGYGLEVLVGVLLVIGLIVLGKKFYKLSIFGLLSRYFESDFVIYPEALLKTIQGFIKNWKVEVQLLRHEQEREYIKKRNKTEE
jgi:hypothetical protein